MNKLFIVLGVIVVAVVGYFLFAGSSVDYVAAVTDEVAALETELAEIEAAVEAGTMSPEEAVQAQARIVTRLDAINAAVEGSGKAKLTEQQRVTLINGLASLQTTLTKYRATLVAVEEKVAEVPEEDRPTLNRGSKSKSLAVVLAETATVLEEVAQDASEELVDIIEDVVEEVASTTEAAMENDSTEVESDTMPTMDGDTDEMVIEDTESTDEDSMDEEPTIDDSSSTDTETESTDEMDMGTEVELDLSATTTAQ